ncbi:MmcB family DNA repair protein [Lichenihabitans psoromatis]|uniref:MmcB family DNA repair protein n=1 Tax=Lichenihabitans psoromatis TaxID=2528642 RepID=UPI001036A926|nr:MmcB family DNA repair protein [Lichenihabitans psoromatis]
MAFRNEAIDGLPDDGRQSEMARVICKGLRRMLRSRNLASVTELVLPDGRRADVMALGANGTLAIIEVKSSVADFRADTKWPIYRAHCDRLYFAVSPDMPVGLMPPDAGLIVADAYGAEILREAPEHRLAGATRRALLIRFAQAAADRLHLAYDPESRLS